MKKATVLAALFLGTLGSMLMAQNSAGKEASPCAEAPAKPLFKSALSSLAEKRFTVTSIKLQTLVNSFPESEYAGWAKILLEDPRIANCNARIEWSNSPCSGGSSDPKRINPK